MDINQMMRDPATVNCRVYVGNTKEGLTAPELTGHFSRHGTILGVTVNRGFCFIQFDNEASAAAAIQQENGATLQGRKLNVRTAVKSSDKNKIPYQHPPQDIEMVGGKVVPQDLNRMPRPHSRKRGGGAGGAGVQHSNFNAGETHPNGRDRSPLVSNEHPAGNQDQRWGNPNQTFNNGNGRHMEPVSRYNQPPQTMQGPPGQAPYHNIPQNDVSLSNSSATFSGDRNDCEIIVVSRNLTQYAEAIEGRLKRMGLRVDLLYPNEDVPVGKLLNNIVSRGCLYAILVVPVNEQHRSITVNVLHGETTEHRNMPVDDALEMINEDFHSIMNQTRRPFSKPNMPTAVEITPTSSHAAPPLNTRHPDAIQTLVNLLADNRPITVLQYDRVIRYLQERREFQLKAEIGDAPPEIKIPAPTPPVDPEIELQKKIMDILNKPSITTPSVVAPIPVVPVETRPAPSVPAVAGASTSQQPKLLADPKVQKALDSLLSGSMFNF